MSETEASGRQSRPVEATVGAMTLAQRGKLLARLRNAGDLDAANEINAMQGMLNKLIPVMEAAVNLVCAPGWSGVSNEDCDLEKALRRTGFVRPNGPHEGSDAGTSTKAGRLR